MSAGPRANQFAYTAAAFGYSGSEGFQFVGLPAEGTAESQVEAIERHLGYSPPLDAPVTPDDAAIVASYPVSIRLLYPKGSDRAALISSRYVGRTYRSDGERGKWGNFFVHALVLDASADPRTLAALAVAAPWRTALTPQEHLAHQPLSLLSVTLPQAADAGATQPGDQALLAAVLIRLTGGPPALLLGMPFAVALEHYARIQRLLPPVLLRRLAWSTYEFDGASGYDVVATVGQTQLSLSPAGYVQPGVTPMPVEVAWAADQCIQDAEDFWQRVELVAGSSLESAALKPAFLTLKALTDDDVHGPDLGALRKIFSALRIKPATPALVQAAHRLFNQAFRARRLADFAVLATAYREAKSFADWSGRPGWTETLASLTSQSPSLLACFAGAGDPAPLTGALDATLAAGLLPEEAVVVAVEAAAPHVQAGRDPQALHRALHAFLAKAFTGEAAWSALLSRLARVPEQASVATALLRLQAAAAGGRWFDAVANSLRREAPSYAEQELPALQATLVVDTYADRSSEFPWRVRALGALEPSLLKQHLPEQDLARWVEYIDMGIADFPEPAARSELAHGLVAALDRWPAAGRPDEKCIANSLCLKAAGNPTTALALVEDAERLALVSGTVYAAPYFALAQAAWVEGEARWQEAAFLRTLFLKLWRADITADWQAHVRQRLDTRLSRGDAAFAFLQDELFNARGRGAGMNAWKDVMRQLAIKSATRLSDAQFEALIGAPRTDPAWRDAMISKRSFSLKGVQKTLGKLAHGLAQRLGRR